MASCLLQSLIPAQCHKTIMKDTQITELRSIPKSPYLGSPNRRKLFILKDQTEFFCLLVYVLKKGALVFSPSCQVDVFFVSASYCVLPLLFNTSWVSVLWYFYTHILVLWVGREKRLRNLGWQVIHRSEHHPLGFVADQPCEQLFEMLFSFYALYL